MGLFRNEEIGKLFGVSHTAVSHIVREVEELIKKEPPVRRKASEIDSQFKM
jgi:chromosomal replication initiation ATPase DnaA